MRSLLALLLVGCTAADAAGPDPLDDPDLCAAVAALCEAATIPFHPWDPEARAQEPPGRLERARLVELIEAGAGDLNQAALAALTDPDPERRLRTGLVLQTLPQAEATLERLSRSDDPREWAWASLAEKDYPLARQPVDLFREAHGDEARRVLDRCAPDLRELLQRDEEELTHMKAEYIESYRNVLLPNLAQPARYLKELDARRVDLNGDGREEWCLLGELEDGWVGVQFLLIVDGASERALRTWAPEQHDRLRHMESYDVDDDGRPELLVSGHIVAGWTYGLVIVHDLDHAEPTRWIDRSSMTVSNPSGDEVWFVTADAWNTTSGGKSSYLNTAYGSRYVLERVGADGEVAERVEVHTGVSVW